MAVDESFKRPGSIPFKWEVQPGIPKQEEPPAAGDSTAAPGLPPATPRLALPPAAHVIALASSASCRRSSVSSVSSAPFSPPTPTLPPPPPASPHHHRRSMSARFATSLVLPFTRRPRRARTAKDDVDYCLLYSEKIA